MLAPRGQPSVSVRHPAGRPGHPKPRQTNGRPQRPRHRMRPPDGHPALGTEIAHRRRLGREFGDDRRAKRPSTSMLWLMSDHRPLHELREWLDQIRGAPSTEGRIELIVRRPVVEAREVITHGELRTTNGLIGDNWSAKPTSATGMPNPKAQLTLMNRSRRRGGSWRARPVAACRRSAVRRLRSQRRERPRPGRDWQSAPLRSR